MAKKFFTYALAFCFSVAAAPMPELSASPNCFISKKGEASWYGPGFHTKKTANGEKFDRWDAKTAAHKTLPFNSLVRVTDLETGRSHTVRINDRGPYKRGRVIDLSQAAAKRLGLESKQGVTDVRLDVLRCGD